MASRSKRTRKRDCCTICSHEFPSSTAYDEEGYEMMIVDHMLQCSASSAGSTAKAPSDAPHPKHVHVDDDRKPAAVKHIKQKKDAVKQTKTVLPKGSIFAQVKNPGISAVPFSLESCVTAVTNDTSKKQSDEKVATAECRQQRTSLRQKDEPLVMACPICRKSFNKFLQGTVITEDSMSRHVERCSRKLLSASVSRRKKQSFADSSHQANMVSNVAVVAALKRPRNRHRKNGHKSNEERQMTENERQARRAADMTDGGGKRALDNWVLGK